MASWWYETTLDGFEKVQFKLPIALSITQFEKTQPKFPIALSITHGQSIRFRRWTADGGSRDWITAGKERLVSNFLFKGLAYFFLGNLANQKHIHSLGICQRRSSSYHLKKRI